MSGRRRRAGLPPKPRREVMAPVRSESWTARRLEQAQTPRDRAVAQFDGLRARMKDPNDPRWEQLADQLAGIHRGERPARRTA